MGVLHFEKLSQFDRRAEPVSTSIPFCRGKLPDPDQLVIRDRGATVPTQQRALANWDDGSVKWLLVHLQPDLPGNEARDLRFEVSADAHQAEPDEVVALTESAHEGMAAGIRVDTGPLSFMIPSRGFWPVQRVELHGHELWGEAPLKGFRLVHDGECLSTDASSVELEVEESGPLRAVILIRGKHHRPDGHGYIDLRGRITAYAGKSYVEVEHQFIHTEEEGELSLEALGLSFAPLERGAETRIALGEGYYRTTIQEGGEELSKALTTQTLLYQANEHFIDSYYGDFWADWRDENGGLALTVHQAHQNFPKQLEVSQTGIVCSLYPAEAPPAPLLQGMGKTHRLQLHFHTSDMPLQEVSVRSLQFQLPDRPSLTRSWFRDNNPWGEAFFPQRLPGRLLTHLNELHDGRPKAMGIFHFGDAPDAGYTDQGRGQGESVWVNNEYDRPHCCALYYGLTGQRRALDSALVCARHWLDVDLCHYSPDPLLHGGLKVHTRYHGTGGVTPSHEWTEGFLDYYFLTGRGEGLEAARSVAENVLRHMARPELSEAGAASVREGGWALRSLVGMWLATGEERWRSEARRIAEMFLGWYEEYGALLAPYTSHTMPRVPFMVSLTVNSFARYLLIQADVRIEKLIVAVMDDLIEHCLGPDGIFYYKELPSLQRTAPTPHALEALTYTYRITGDVEYLKIAARQFAALTRQTGGAGSNAKYADPSGAVIAGRGGGRSFADKYMSLLLFAGEATPLGLLDWYEYPFSSHEEQDA